MPDDTKRPHIVPFVHLAYFASNPNAPKKEKRIHTFSKRQNQHLYDLTKEGKVPRLIKKVAVEPEFYEKYGQGDEREKCFGILESVAARVLEVLVKTGTDKRIRKKQRQKFSEFLAVMHYRTLKQRLFLERERRVFVEEIIEQPNSESAREYFDYTNSSIKAQHDRAMSFLNESYIKAQKLPELEKEIAVAKISVKREEAIRGWERSKNFEARHKRAMEDEEIRGRFIELLKDTRSRHLDTIDLMSQRLAQIINRAKWEVKVNRSIVPFFTTDNPLVVYPLAEPGNDERIAHKNFELSKLGLVGFADDQNNYPPYALYFPLNPRLVLCITPTLQHNVIFDIDRVLDFQYLQCMQAHDEMYSHENVGFMLAEKAFSTEKEIRAVLGLRSEQDWL